MTTPEPTPDGPACTLCSAPAVASWQRRLTEAEVAVEQAKEQARRDQAHLLADLQQPPALWPPLPTCADWTRIVHGCIHHAIGRDAATLVHQADCTAPAEADLPGCNCTPEQAPLRGADPPAQHLPVGWA